MTNLCGMRFVAGASRILKRHGTPLPQSLLATLTVLYLYMIPSRVLSTTTCTFILFLIPNVDIAGTATPTAGSDSSNIIDYATASADRKCFDAIGPRSTVEYTLDKHSLSVTLFLFECFGRIERSGQSIFHEMRGTNDIETYGYPTVPIVTNGTPNADTMESLYSSGAFGK